MSLMISVSGVRGLVGKTLTPQVVLDFAHAYGSVLGGGSVVLARDSRPSGELFAAAAAAGLLAAGCRVVQIDVAMTPTAALTIRSGKHSGGLIITASHNPQPWNGLKFLDELGLAPDPQRVQQVNEIRERRTFHNITEGFSPLVHDRGAGERHVVAVLKALEVDIGRLKGMRVVLDSVNGAGCADSPRLLTAMGCEVIHLNSEPTGMFAHPPEPLAENLMQLCDAVRGSRAAIGFAQDPDADRLAIVDERGAFIGEEYTLALAAESVLSRRPGNIAANLSTSRMVDDIAARHRGKVLRTPVGEAHVARAVLAADCVIGGEGNGGVIDPRISPVRDSLSAMSLVLQLLAASGQPLSKLVAGLPRYAMIKQKFEVERETIASAVERVASHFEKQGGGRTNSARVDRADGVRVDLAEGWVHVRPSNTEPIVRFIAEAGDEAAAQRLIAQAREAAGL